MIPSADRLVRRWSRLIVPPAFACSIFVACGGGDAELVSKASDDSGRSGRGGSDAGRAGASAAGGTQGEGGAAAVGGGAGADAAAAGASSLAGAAGDNAAAGFEAGTGGSGDSGAGGAGGDVGAEAGAAGAGAGAPEACAPPCSGSQFCSASATCIPFGTCSANEDCALGKLCDKATKTCVIGSTCGVTKVSTMPVAPNLLIVLDRSCSMKKMAAGQTKWKAAQKAITSLTSSFKTSIRFGMTMFPDTEGSECGQNGSSLINVSDGAYKQIQNRLENAQDEKNSYYPDDPCVTNIDSAMDEASKVPTLLDKSRKSFVLLITDGAQSGCNLAGGNGGTKTIITNLHASGVGTFVVGFSDEVSEANLNAFAQLGGYPNPAANIDYYKANNEASLTTALSQIAKQTLGCTFALGKTPPDPSSLYVFFDNKDQIARDATHQAGWDYDAAQQQVTFYGATCQSIQAGSIGQLDIVYGCPGDTTGSGGDGVMVPATCASQVGCNATHLCPPDAQQRQGLCSVGCCLYGKD
jgi:hypothetical protein